MFNWELTTLKDVIETVKTYRDAWIYDDNGDVKEDVMVIDFLNVLDDLKEFEDADVDKEAVAELWNNDYTRADNSYNWCANTSNDFEYRSGKIDGEDYVLLAVHLYGDARCNYTDYVALKMDLDDFFSLDSWYDFKPINDRYTADINGLSDSYNVYDNETQDDIGEYYDLEAYDLLEHLKEDGFEV